MSIPNKQIGWSNESNLLWYILKQLNKLTSIIFNLKPKYKVYTALLTQSGGENWINNSTDSPEPFIVGVTYYIDENNDPAADFTNIGAPNNNVGTSFVATGTTPNSWGNGGYVNLRYNTGAPVATALENTIGNIWWTYGGIGYYIANSTNLFGINKTTVFLEPSSNLMTNGFFEMNDKTINTVEITFSQNTSGLSDNALKNTAIEIRVYN